jgi:hypothetical protein
VKETVTAKEKNNNKENNEENNKENNKEIYKEYQNPLQPFAIFILKNSFNRVSKLSRDHVIFHSGEAKEEKTQKLYATLSPGLYVILIPTYLSAMEGSFSVSLMANKSTEFKLLWPPFWMFDTKDSHNTNPNPNYDPNSTTKSLSLTTEGKEINNINIKHIDDPVLEPPMPEKQGYFDYLFSDKSESNADPSIETIIKLEAEEIKVNNNKKNPVKNFRNSDTRKVSLQVHPI